MNTFLYNQYRYYHVLQNMHMKIIAVENVFRCRLFE